MMRRSMLAAFAVGISALTAGPVGAAAADVTETVRMSADSWAGTTTPAPGAAQSLGGYAGGCVQGAVALPPEGPGYQALRLSRKRNYGHPALVKFLQDLGKQGEKHGLGVMMVADLSQPRGGPMPNGHASHQIGLDADIWLRLDQPLLSRAERETPTAINYVDYTRQQINAEAWRDKQAQLIRLAATDHRIARIFVNPFIKQQLCRSASGADQTWLGKVRPWYGHDSHMHVRLGCPADSPACVEQAAPPPGDGCGEELDWWLAEVVKPVEPKPPGEQKPRQATLPKACEAVLKNNARAVRPAAFPEPAYR